MVARKVSVLLRGIQDLFGFMFMPVWNSPSARVSRVSNGSLSVILVCLHGSQSVQRLCKSDREKRQCMEN